MSERLSFVDLLLIAEGVLDESAERLARTVLVPGAESALAAPFATFAGVEFYEDPAERAAICCDGLPWPRPREDAQEIGDMVEGLAAREVSEREFVAWVKKRTDR